MARAASIYRFSDVRSGAFSTELGCPRDVRSTPVSDRIADIPDRQLRANFGSETHSLDHLVGLGKQRRGHREAERLGSYSPAECRSLKKTTRTVRRRRRTGSLGMTANQMQRLFLFLT
jgi:hypothetical protein